MQLSVVIPAKNEAQRISQTLNNCVDYLKKNNIDYEIIVVDDGSTDDTRKEVEKFSSQSVRITPMRENRGKGASVREGMLLSTKTYAMFMDADNSTSIEELEAFWPNLEDYDILIASRNLKESVIAIPQPKLRSMLGKAFPLLVGLLAVRGIKDTQCGFKLFNRKTVSELFPRSILNRWGFDVELLFIAKKRGLKIKELPVTWKNDSASKLRPFRDALDMFVDLLRIRIYSLKGRYK